MPIGPTYTDIPITQEVHLGGQVVRVDKGLVMDLLQRYPVMASELKRILPDGHAGIHASFTVRGGRLWVTGLWVRRGDHVSVDERVHEVLLFGQALPVLAWWVREEVPVPLLRDRQRPAVTGYRLSRFRDGIDLHGPVARKYGRAEVRKSWQVRWVTRLTALALSPLICFWLVRGRWPHLRLEGAERTLATLMLPFTPVLCFTTVMRMRSWSQPLPDVVHRRLLMLMTWRAHRNAVRRMLHDALGD